MAISVSKPVLAGSNLCYNTKSPLDSDFFLLRALTWSFCSGSLNKLLPELVPAPQILFFFSLSQF